MAWVCRPSASLASTVGTLQICRSPPLQPPQLRNPGPLPQAAFQLGLKPPLTPWHSSLFPWGRDEASGSIKIPTCLYLFSLTSFSNLPGMFSASEQREVHLTGLADGAHAAGPQISPPSPGAQGDAQAWVWHIDLPARAPGGWAPLSGWGHWGHASTDSRRRKKELVGQACLEGSPG